MLSQFLLLKLFKSELFSCLPKVDHVIKSCKEPIGQQLTGASAATIPEFIAGRISAPIHFSFLKWRMESCCLLVKCIIILLIYIFNELQQNEGITYCIEHFPHCSCTEIMFTKVVRQLSSSYHYKKRNDVRYGRSDGSLKEEILSNK